MATMLDELFDGRDGVCPDRLSGPNEVPHVHELLFLADTVRVKIRRGQEVHLSALRITGHFDPHLH